jgi:hypothetical protein
MDVLVFAGLGELPEVPEFEVFLLLLEELLELELELEPEFEVPLVDFARDLLSGFFSCDFGFRSCCRCEERLSRLISSRRSQ